MAIIGESKQLVLITQYELRSCKLTLDTAVKIYTVVGGADVTHLLCVHSGPEHELHPAAEEDVGQGEHGEVRDPRAPDEPVQQLRQLPLIAEGGAVAQRGRHRGPRESELWRCA